MKITIKTNETKVTIEEHNDHIYNLLDIFKRCAIALTYSEIAWNEAILDEADEIIRNKDK